MMAFFFNLKKFVMLLWGFPLTVVLITMKKGLRSKIITYFLIS